MSKLLETALPIVPDQYEAETWSRIVRELEMALTRVDFPENVSVKDDTDGINWFID